MVRTIETNAADPDEQKATRETTGEVSPNGTSAEQELGQDIHEVVVSAMLESALLGNTNSSRLWVGRSEKAGQLNASENEHPGISIADAWLAEPEWVGESSEAEAEMAAGSREPEE
jgi:hypothetical protein